MSTIKTPASDDSVDDFLNTVSDDTKRKDSFTLLEMFTRLTGETARMWGSSIVGFGTYHYKYERSSQEGDWMLTGFSPRKQSLTLYVMPGFDGYKDLLDRLGPHKTSVSCLYIKKLQDIDMMVLEDLIEKSFLEMKGRNA